MVHLLECLKVYAAHAAKWVITSHHGTVPVYLELDALSETKSYNELEQLLSKLSDEDKSRVHGKVYELAKMKDPTIAGTNWGQEHAFDDLGRLQSAIRRLGFMDVLVLGENENETSTTSASERLHKLQIMTYHGGEGGLGTQYFSLGEKLGRDPIPGHIMFINGMGVPTLEHCGRDVALLSDRFFHSNNIHVIYNPTFQANAYGGDTRGFLADTMRMLAVESGACSRQAYMVVQQWMDYLRESPGRNVLQVAHSEGCVHVYMALKILNEVKREWMRRIRVLAFCPARFMEPEEFCSSSSSTTSPSSPSSKSNTTPPPSPSPSSPSLHQPSGVQILNFVKKEDRTIIPWGIGSSKVSQTPSPPPSYVIVPHKEYLYEEDGHHNDPHDMLSRDFIESSRECIKLFMRTGDIVIINKEE